jgi:hypothetical protein
MLAGDVTDALIRERIHLCEAACDELIAVSEACAGACLALTGDGDITRCLRANLECVKVAELTLRALSWTSSTDHAPTIAALEACVEACTESAAACQRVAELHTPPWVDCTETCHRMSNACTELLVVLETAWCPAPDHVPKGTP